MKNIKLLSALALSATLVAASASLASAAVVTKPGNTATETTSGSAGFITDKTTAFVPQLPEGKGDDTVANGLTNPDVIDSTVKVSDLALYAHPAEFNFGVTKISAADKQKTTVALKQKNWAAANNNADGTDTTGSTKLYSRDFQSLRVQDGRVIPKDWSISAEATPFKDGSKTLTGAVIKISKATKFTSDTKGALSTPAANGAFEIKTTGAATADILKADPEARFTSDLNWKTSDVSLEFPGSVIDTGNFTSTVTWTLTGTPDA
ncbi:WxL domain-containing protein [Pseudolactococcus yaeyamensis]